MTCGVNNAICDSKNANHYNHVREFMGHNIFKMVKDGKMVALIETSRPDAHLKCALFYNFFTGEEPNFLH